MGLLYSKSVAALREALAGVPRGAAVSGDAPRTVVAGPAPPIPPTLAAPAPNAVEEAAITKNRSPYVVGALMVAGVLLVGGGLLAYDLMFAEGEAPARADAGPDMTLDASPARPDIAPDAASPADRAPPRSKPRRRRPVVKKRPRPRRPKRSPAPAPQAVVPRKPKRGTLAIPEIRRIIQNNLAPIRFCRESAVRAGATLRGVVGLRVTVAPSGRVAAAKVERSTVKNPEFERCLVRAAKTWVFPKPRGGGVFSFSYPLVFSSNGRRRRSKGRGNPKLRVPKGEDPLNWL